jgi:assimilatory nitrate reductase catalytic subunit
MRAGVTDGSLVRIETRHGAATVRAVVTDRVAAGSAFAPIHWSAQNSSSGRIGALVHDTADPISGQPDLKATPAQISAVAASHFGFVLTRRALVSSELDHFHYWARSVIPGGYLTVFATRGDVPDMGRLAHSLAHTSEKISVEDIPAGSLRLAALRGGRVDAILYIGKDPRLLPTPWLRSVLCLDSLSPTERRALLAGTLPEAAADQSPIVCVCHQVSMRRITDSILAGATTAEAVGRNCAAGTNCGSCLPEINRLLATTTPQDAARQEGGNSKNGQMPVSSAVCDSAATG